MYGAIMGDIVGSRYEHESIKTKDFPLVSPGCTFTDDTVMTVAVARALLANKETGEPIDFLLVREMQALGRRYLPARFLTAVSATDQPCGYLPAVFGPKAWGKL